jgi:hypothetical protein
MVDHISIHRIFIKYDYDETVKSHNFGRLCCMYGVKNIFIGGNLTVIIDLVSLNERKP